ncbi:uncharacterized protein LOC128394242 isoform X1 [Panonychus citri]|uniref:uncharacterized protein LOC128394242 isoform X1 n=1 Tax=Panonychus citri TaxID=50023 RepID=UPI002307387E|nr:uncharacterized protein LOC128394242 isoform X1 [Panonychus citri]XP_053210518.1 uncharacterized protein LOC128394242 isoform X1 [Panonychus citri]
MKFSKMNIIDLPDDCLLLIFDQFYQYRQFATLMKVCPRWKILAEKRLKKITHLDILLFTSNGLTQLNDTLEQRHFPSTRKCVITMRPDSLKQIEPSKLFPNVKLIHLENFTGNCICDALAQLLTKANQIKGLSCFDYNSTMNHECNSIERITSFLSDIQVLRTTNYAISTSYLRTFGHLKKVKSFGSSNFFRSKRFCIDDVHLRYVLKFAQCLTNLEQLTTYCDDKFDDDFVLVESQLPIFGNLLHLELVDASNNGSTLTKFLNLCPNLLNFSLTVYFNKMNRILQINRNFNVQRLDLDFFTKDRENILKFIEKFPNCRYLSIRNSLYLLSSQDLIQIKSKLPHLSLLHFKNDWTDLAEIQTIKNYCHSQNPKIDVYFGSEDDKLMMSHEIYRKFRNSFLPYIKSGS